MTALTIQAVPAVVDDDELPFVLGLAADPRPCLDVDGVQLRRGVDRCVIDYLLDPLRLRAVLLEGEDGNCYLAANCGPILNEWWPLLVRENGNPIRPWLTAGVTGRPRTMRLDAASLAVAVAPPGPLVDSTMAAVGLRGPLSTETIERSLGLAPPVIRAALQVLVEYRSLVGEVPDVDVQTAAGSLPLVDMLQLAEAAAGAISWEPAP